jgi:CheY-like chemotaxis protein
VGDDRENIQANDRVVLIVENDLGFAKFLLDLVRENGFKGLVTSQGAAALALTHDYQPEAVLLDIYLLDMQGWRVIERLKSDLVTRHIPVCIISTDDFRDRALASGALAFVAKPIQSRDVLDQLINKMAAYNDREEKSILVIEPDKEKREQTISDLESDGVEILAEDDPKKVSALAREQKFDCIVVSPEAKEAIQSLIEGAEESPAPLNRTPVVVYGEGEISEETLEQLRKLCFVRAVQTPDRLLDLATLALHKEVQLLPEAQRKKLTDLYQSDKVLAEKRALIVDDDARNIFALTSLLEDHHMHVLSAENGRNAIKLLQEEPEVDIVLMDIMMPEMDGIETIRAIRKIPGLKNLPIIAVTAKAMKGDREKCIEAGAWDYLSKPVDTEQMLAVLRAWLHR